MLHQAPDLPDLLIGDPFRIQQILINLVGNAIKFTDRGEILIRLEQTALSSGRIALRVSVGDTGIGMTPAQMERAFQPFEQFAAHDAPGPWTPEGTGLGLAICKRIVDAMGGCIGVESRFGEGSEFWFQVPVRPVEAPTGAPRWLIPDPWRGARVLVCVGHAATRESIVSMLTLFGFEVRAHAMIDQASDTPACDLLVFDDTLPAGDGMALLNARRATAPTLPALYVANLFGYERAEDDAPSRLPSGVPTLMKPVHASPLFDALMELFDPGARSSVTAAVRTTGSWEAVIRELGARERLAGARLLLVEDNEINRDVATEALHMVGIRVDVARHGAEAVDRVLSGERFDAILMDLQMPVMDGFQAAQSIRRHHGPEQLPIIAMTAGVLFRDRQRCEAVGMNGHVGKPINLWQLLETLMQWVAPAAPGRDTVPPPVPEDAAPALDPELAAIAARIGLDVRRGLEQLGGNRALYLKLLGRFASSQRATRTGLLGARETGDLATIRRLAHTINGVASTLGATRLQALAQAVEQAAAEGDADRAREQSWPLAREVGQLVTALDAPSPSAPPWPGATDRAARNAARSSHQCRELMGLLDQGDTRAIEMCARQHDWLLALLGDAATLQNFVDLIEHYSFDEARILLAGLESGIDHA